MSQITATKVFNAVPAEVWEKIGNPGKISEWHPAIAKSESEGDNRTCTLGDGAIIKEQIMSHDDGNMKYTYVILESPLPVRDYESTVAVEADGAGSKVIWTSQFEVVDAPAEEIEEMIQGLYDGGLENLANLI